MRSRWLLIVATLIGAACHSAGHHAGERAPETDAIVASSPEVMHEVVVTGHVVRDGAPLAGVRAYYGIGDADADVSDEAGEFQLVLTDDFARAPAIYLRLETSDGKRSGGVLRNIGRAFSVDFDLREPVGIELHDGSPEDQAWVDVHAWAMGESDEWSRTPDDNHAHLAQWKRVAEAIAAEPDVHRRGLMIAAQFMIGRGAPELGLDRSATANAALTELGLEDPRWSIFPPALATAAFESGRWAELAPGLDELITHHPQPEVAVVIMLVRYSHLSVNGPPAEAKALWQRWLDRPALARAGALAATVTSLGPKRPLAPGQRLPELCVENLAGGPLCLADLRGRMVVLEIWSTWCQGCRTTAITLRAAHASLVGEDAPLFVSIDAYDSPETIATFLDEEPMPWRHGWIHEPEREAFLQTLDVQSIPTLVLIDAEGTILASSPELQAEHLLEQIETLRRGLD